MLTFTEKMCSNFKTVLEYYKKSVKERFGHECTDPWVLFVVEDVERNVMD